MQNQEIRTKMIQENVKQWQVAEAMNIHEGTFSRYLRKELSEEKKQSVLQAIDEAKQIQREGAS